MFWRYFYEKKKGIPPYRYRKANHFIEYFTNLVSSLHNSGAANFLGVPNSESSFFQPTSPDEVCTIFMSLKNTQARDNDGLQIKPTKFIIDILVPVLTHIVYNLCLSTGVLPSGMHTPKLLSCSNLATKTAFPIIGLCQCPQ